MFISHTLMIIIIYHICPTLYMIFHNMSPTFLDVFLLLYIIEQPILMDQIPTPYYVLLRKIKNKK
ncbi:hypothetical protein BCR42DRAFT_426851 [Absidia repens]|uniref:Uncharacterized protein n=1 Tax=Absidia repens TaxID=90262 RepID=A0A1X2I0B9_9FUNG|nr:hypothetical protein BCR42DRAFT_426851 [Absidia repens]